MPALAAEIYALTDPRDGGIRYIGKANEPKKRLAAHIKAARRSNLPVHNWVRQLLAIGLKPVQITLIVCGRDDWQENEIKAIRCARELGIPLLNVAPGGEGGYTPPERKSEQGREHALRFADKTWKRVWSLNRSIGRYVREGSLTERNRERVRYAAIKAPHLFGQWANI